MIGILPLDHAVRNLTRRPLRTALTALSSALVAGVVMAVAAFVRALSVATVAGGATDVTLLLSVSAERDMARSAVTAAAPAIVQASVASATAISPEVTLASELELADGRRAAAVLRGVLPAAFRVHTGITLVEGALPGTGEVLAGELAAAKLGVTAAELRPGTVLHVEGRGLRVSGTFAAPGSPYAAELWAPLDLVQSLARRNDLSVVQVRGSADGFADLELLSKRRLDLELTALTAVDYWRGLGAALRPIQGIAWLIAGLAAFACVCGGATTLNAAVQDRLRELATLRAVGFSTVALAWSLFQEALLVAAAGSLCGLLAARVLLSGVTFRLAMSAYVLEPDASCILFGVGAALLVGALGAVPALLAVVRIPVAAALKEP